MPALGLDLPSQFDIGSIVEWTESLMLLRGVDELSRTAIRSEFTGGDEPDSTVLDGLLGEVRRRSQFAPRSYPFRVADDDVITLGDAGIDRAFYELLVLLSQPDARFRQDGRETEADRAFAFVVREALARMHSDDGKALRFASPGLDGRPDDVREAARWLGEQMGVERVAVDALPAATGESGLLVVSWRRFAAGGGPYDIMLVRNGLALEAEPREEEIPHDTWMRVYPGAVTPREAVAVARVVEPGSDLEVALAAAGRIVLDRLKLCELTDVGELAAFAEEWRALRRWIAAERAAREQEEQRPPEPQERRRNPFRDAA